MKVAFVTFFALLGLLQYGILLSAWSAYKSDARPISLKYWSRALALSATSYFCFAAALLTSEEELNQSNSLITLANMLIMASVLYQGLFARALRADILPVTISLITISIALYGLLFELLRHYGSFESRSALVGILLFFIYLWQIHEINKTRRNIPSKNLNVLLVLVVLEAIFILARAIALHFSNAQVQVLNQVPIFTSLLLWLQLTLNILAYVTMIGYWVEDITAKNVKSDYENTKIKALLDEKNHLLQNLIKTKKMAEMGAMSASIAHEINQPLAAIKLNAWSLKRTHQQHRNLSALQSGLVDQTVKDIDRVATIISTLRTVFKDKANDTKQIGLQQFIERLKPLLEAELGSRDINLNYDVPHNLRVFINESELTLVLLNLVNNAAKAGAKTIRVTATSSDERIQLTIEDDGHGVANNAEAHLFEIAKDSETSGLGLGLWLSKYIMERSGGSIGYAPRMPNGAIFSLQFPPP